MPRILVVDDDRFSLELMADIICTLLGIPEEDVIMVSDGDAAIRAIQGTVFNLVITDFNLPGKEDGLAVIRAAKEWDPETKTILASAKWELLVDSGEAGITSVDKLLKKPFDIHELVAAVKKLLGL